MENPNNTNTAYGFTAMRSQAPENSSAVIVWMFIGFTLCICLGASAWILFQGGVM